MAETERNERVEAIVEALSLAPHLARRLEAMVWDGDAQALALAAIWRDLSTDGAAHLLEGVLATADPVGDEFWLPPELWTKCFEHLEVGDVIRCAAVCKLFRDISSEASVWERFLERLVEERWWVKEAYDRNKETATPSAAMYKAVLEEGILPPGCDDFPMRVALIRAFNGRSELPGNQAATYDAVMGIRKQLATNDPPFDAVISAGVVPEVLAIIDETVAHSVDPSNQLVVEALWVLTNVSAGNARHVASITAVDGALALICARLQSWNVEVRRQAVWAVANIAMTSTDLRDELLGLGAMTEVLNVLMNDLSSMGQAAWCVGCLLYGTPHVDWKYAEMALPTLTRLFINAFPGDELMEDVTKALSYAVEVQVDPIVQTPGVAERLAEILMNPDGEADAGKRGAIKIAGVIASSPNNANTQMLVDNQIIPALNTALIVRVNDEVLVKHALVVFANIIGGTPGQAAAVIESGMVLDTVVSMLNFWNADVCKEAFHCLVNLSNVAALHADLFRDRGFYTALTRYVVRVSELTANANADQGWKQATFALAAQLAYLATTEGGGEAHAALTAAIGDARAFLTSTISSGDPMVDQVQLMTYSTVLDGLVERGELPPEAWAHPVMASSMEACRAAAAEQGGDVETTAMAIEAIKQSLEV